MPNTNYDFTVRYHRQQRGKHKADTHKVGGQREGHAYEQQLQQQHQQLEQQCGIGSNSGGCKVATTAVARAVVAATTTAAAGAAAAAAATADSGSGSGSNSSGSSYSGGSSYSDGCGAPTPVFLKFFNLVAAAVVPPLPHPLFSLLYFLT
jgi:bacterioferritin-associated ferredoxin